MRRLRRWVMALFLAALGTIAHGATTPQRVSAFPAEFPYRAFDTADALGRSIRFYLSDAQARDERPLILILQGSGCSSHFTLRDGRVGGGWHNFVRKANNGRAQVLLVEKPGVKLFDMPENPGGGANCSEEFRREQTGERWLAALTAALNAVDELRRAAPRALMVLGHSEGAVFAPRLAVQDKRVTHVASLASSPISQLHDFFDMAASGEGFISKRPGSKAENIDRVLAAWEAVSADPGSETKQVFGHAHRYWADKFAPFDFATLLHTKAKFFMAHGNRDANAAARVIDSFALELLTRKRDLTWLRIDGANHSFAVDGDLSYAGFSEVLSRAVGWFFGEPLERKHVIWPRAEGAPPG